ncbi:MAG: SH3 domain-containing protein [Paracoccaceae bacterium]
MTLGEDHGQKRYGLQLADKQAAEAAAKPAEPVAEPVEVKAVFIPAQPVMKPIEAAVLTAAAATIPPPAPALIALPEPEIPGGELFSVAASGANVRQGAGTDFPVLDSLTGGEQVLVVDDTQPTQGWSKVRLEGDGVEGYVATRLLTAAE